MAELIAAFPKTALEHVSPVLAESTRIIESIGLASDVRAEGSLGGGVVIGRSRAHEPRCFVAAEGRGWIAVKGLLFDAAADDPHVDLDRLWHEIEANELTDWNRYEGTFALAAWVTAERRGLAVNDQTSALNFYYAEDNDYVYVTTAALPVARALGRGLDPAAVREFLARGALLAPASMFDGFKRLDVGEHLAFEDGTHRIRRHWYYPETLQNWSFGRAVEEAAQVSSDRMRRYGAVCGGPVLCDLTSGYDSRIIASAADHAGLHPTVTVNGTSDDEEVVIAKRVADVTGWPILHFDPRETLARPIDARVRRELTYRTDGNLPFTEIYLQYVTRPDLSRDYAVHAAGVGGEFIRYHPWGQEFFGIGRRRPANVDNIIRYRMLQTGLPPASLFADAWQPRFRNELRDHVDAVCRSMPNTLTTQQLDAVHVWKQTAHPSLYVSAAFNWLATTVPSMGAGYVAMGMVTPWRFRVSTKLTRHVIHALCPSAAKVVTRYGGTAGPVRASNAHLHALQAARQLGHLASKVDRIAFGGVLTGPFREPAVGLPRPYRTDEFRRFLAADSMFSSTLYARDELTALLSTLATHNSAGDKLILRIATIEQLCRELDYRPPPGILLQ